MKIETEFITNWDSFHDIFQSAFGFPDFYGRNLNAWIDCMTCLDDGLTKFNLEKDELLFIEMSQTESFSKRVPDIFIALMECVASVNQRSIENGEKARIVVLFV